MAQPGNVLSEAERRMRGVLVLVAFVLFTVFVIGLSYIRQRLDAAASGSHSGA